MKLIPLARGMSAMVDDEDFELLSKFKWHLVPSRDTFYASRGAPRKFPNGRYAKPVCDGPATVGMHRQILGMTQGKDQVDHIDGNGLNNQKSNLRIADHRLNQANTKKTKRACSSKFKGVSWNKHAKKWTASFGPPESRFCLGYCTTEKEAALLYNLAASFKFREFANLNKIEV